jgi:putative ABC transport system permease protein
MRPVALIDDVSKDLRYAARVLLRNPSFAAMAILTLALGIGANTAIFTLVDAVLLKSLPVRDPKSLVIVDTITPRGERRNISHPLFQALRSNHEIFTGLLAAQDGTSRLEMSGSEPAGIPEEVVVQLVSGDYFDVLGIPPAAGRTLSAADDTVTAPGVAVVSDGFWKRRFNHDPATIGSTITIKNEAITIVGSAPAGFFGESVGRLPDFWVPLALQPRFDRLSMLDDPRTGWLQVVGRLRPGLEADHAAAGLQLFLTRSNQELSTVNRSTRFIDQIQLSDGSRGLPGLRERFATPLRILMAIVLLVLLIACANVSNLLLARALARQREVAVRLAIGAARRRLIRQFLTESLLLAVISALVGLIVAWWGSTFLLVLASDNTAPIPIDVTPDARILAFTLSVSLVAVLFFGLLPALNGSRVDLHASLKSSATPFRRATISRLLVVGQVAVSLVLLAGAALFLQTLHNLRTRDLGFASETLLQGRIRPEQSGYNRGEVAAVSRRVLERASAIAGVEAATMANSGYATGMSTTCCFAVQGYDHRPGEDRQVNTLGIGTNYFRTMGIPLRRGHEFTEQDLIDDPRQPSPVAIVNSAFAERYLRGSDPIGRHIGWGEPPNVKYDMQVVGVAGDVVYGNPREAAKPVIYLPSSRGTMLLIRATGSSSAMIRIISREIHAFAPKLEFSMRPVSSEVQRALSRETLLSRLASFFGALAVVLAAIGLYGLLTFTVARRTREIGICMALGADRRSILFDEIRGALRLMGLGIVIGLPLAVAGAHLIRSQLFGVTAWDPFTFAVAFVILVAAALVAAWIPARRAARIEPMDALRWD